jgi:hypothetical protein
VNQPDTIGTVEAAEILGWSTTKLKVEAQKERVPTLGKMKGQTGAYLFSRAVIQQLANQAAA